MIRLLVSYFLQTPSKSFCKSEGKKAGKNTFYGAMFLWDLHKNIVPLFWSSTTKNCSNMAKMGNMLQHLRQESLSYRWIKESRCLESCPLPPPRIPKSHTNSGAFSNHLVKTPGLSQLLLLDIATGEYYIFLVCLDTIQKSK